MVEAFFWLNDVARLLRLQADAAVLSAGVSNKVSVEGFHAEYFKAPRPVAAIMFQAQGRRLAVLLMHNKLAVRRH